MSKEEQIEHQVRSRLAGALSQAGVGYDRVSIEVLYLLPPEFVNAYQELYYQALSDASGSLGKENFDLVGKGGKKALPAAKGGKKFREHWQIRDDKAFARKKRVDRKLRMLIKEIRGVEEDKRHRKRCQGCGRWAEKAWNYCGWCGDVIKGDKVDKDKETGGE